MWESAQARRSHRYGFSQRGVSNADMTVAERADFGGVADPAISHGGM